MLVTENLSEGQIENDPFPLLVVPNVLDAALHEALKAGLPPLEALTKGQKYPGNFRLNYAAADLLASPNVPPVWKHFVHEHLGQAFIDDVLRLFGGAIEAEYPGLVNGTGALPALKAGVRSVDNDSDAQVLLDCQLAVNTPVTIGGTTVRAPHIDCPKKLFVGLLYLRLDGDESTGGDLEIYRPAKGSPNLDHTRTALLSDMDVVRRISYESNTLVLFLNTSRSFHGVTVRGRTPHHRLFVNLLGEMREPLFRTTVASRSAPPIVPMKPGGARRAGGGELR